MGFTTQYAWHPAKQQDPEEDVGNKLVKRASQKLVTTPLDGQLSTGQWEVNKKKMRKLFTHDLICSVIDI